MAAGRRDGARRPRVGLCDRLRARCWAASGSAGVGIGRQARKRPGPVGSWAAVVRVVGLEMIASGDRWSRCDAGRAPGLGDPVRITRAIPSHHQTRLDFPPIPTTAARPPIDPELFQVHRREQSATEERQATPRRTRPSPTHQTRPAQPVASAQERRQLRGTKHPWSGGASGPGKGSDPDAACHLAGVPLRLLTDLMPIGGRGRGRAERTGDPRRRRALELILGGR